MICFESKKPASDIQALVCVLESSFSYPATYNENLLGSKKLAFCLLDKVIALRYSKDTDKPFDCAHRFEK